MPDTVLGARDTAIKRKNKSLPRLEWEGNRQISQQINDTVISDHNKPSEGKKGMIQQRIT